MGKTRENQRRTRLVTLAAITAVCLCVIVGIMAGGRAWREEKLQETKQQELQEASGRFSAETIVLADTTPEQAQYLAQLLQARLRMTEDGSYAVLYLPEGVGVEDVYASEEYKPYLSAMSLDYYVNASAVDANNRELVSTRPSFVVTDEGYPQQNYLDYIDLMDTWETTRGAGVTVAVIDSGIDTDHPDFAGKISSRSYDASNDRVVADYDLSVIEDTDGHGTSVAGVIAAGMNDGVGITGIAPEVELIVIKCETDGNGNFLRSSDLVFGLAYAIECDVDVVNMSFGTEINVFEKYTRLAVDSDIICVAAAGNEGSALPSYPAADENVIGVGAMDMNTWGLADYSNYGHSLVLAPGTAYTTALNGGYRSTTGTSISSPVVTSAVALYLSVNPYTEFHEMCELLKASSVDLGILGEDRQHGFGALDVYALVLEEKGTITYEMLTDELRNQTQIFVKGHTIQYMPEPERETVVLDGWYHDIECTDEVPYFENVFTEDVTLYASWINEDDGTAYIYTVLDDGTVEIRSYTGRRRYLTIPAVLEGKLVSSIGEYAFAGNTRLRSVSLPESLVNISAGAFSDCSSLRMIEIPDKVVSIGNRAFYGCASLSQVSLMKSGALTSIGDQSFGMCGISSIHLPKNLKTLGAGVFYGSTGMTAVTVEAGNAYFQVRNEALYDAAGTTLVYYPAGLTGSYTLESNTLDVAKYAFAYSRSSKVVLNEGLLALGANSFEYSYIRSAEIPTSVQKMGAFCYSNSRLSEITFKDGIGIVAIPEGAFFCCSYLKTVTLPAGVTVIGSNAFGNSGVREVRFVAGSELVAIDESAFSSSALTKIAFPASLERIAMNAFAYCQNLTEVIWEQGSRLERIGQYAFVSCSALKQIALPASLEEVGYQGFFGSGLEELTIGANLTVLGDGAFAGCRNLKEIQVESGNSAFRAVDGVLFTADKKLLHTYPAGRSGAYTVPETVTRIGDYAFANAENLTNVTFNTGLEEISGYAFSCCSALNTPTLPASLTTIGENAFEYCSSMNGSLTVPKNVISIGRFAFYQDFGLTQIRIEPESKLSRIGYGTFGYCGITDFTVPRSVSTMGQEVFVGCKNLLTVTFEADSKLENLAAWTFSGAEELRQITFEEGSSLKLLEARSLEGLRKLERITLEYCTQLTTIDNHAFQYCVSLTEITLPESLTEIGRYAFNGCSSLSRIDLPEGVVRIGRYAFNRTGNLNVYFRASVLPLYLEENWNYGISGYYVATAEVITSGNWQYALTKDGKVSIVAYTGNESHIHLTDLDGYEIISIGGYAFADNGNLQSIILPETVQGVYQYAFKGTTSLDSITIPANVAILDTGAFQGSGVSSVTFAEGSALVSLGRYAFADTHNLASITIPDGVEAIHDYTFRNSGIRQITFGEKSALAEIGRYAFQGSGLESVTIPAGVTRIDYDAFWGCVDLTHVDLSKTSGLQIFANAFYGSGLTEIAIPVGVEYIGEFCFASCPNLTNITVDGANENYASLEGVLYNKAMTKLITCPAGLTGSYTIPATVSTLGFAAFEGSRLSEVIFPADSALVTLGYRVFYNCDNLTAIAIPAGVQSIDNYAFAECNNLTDVTFTADSQLGGIYKSAFYNCTALTDVSIPAGVQEIGDYAFYGCTNLTELNIPEDSRLKSIYDYAFAYTGLTEFVMPEGLVEIGTSAFQNAELDTLVCNETITIIGDFAFDDCGLANTMELYIPATVEYLGRDALRGAYNIVELTIPFLGTHEGDKDQAQIGTLFGITPTGAVVDELCLERLKIYKGTYVGEYAFSCCGNLTSIELSNDTTEIETWAFLNTDVREIVIPPKVLRIGYGAFERTPLESVSLPEGLATIDARAFAECKLENVELPSSLVYLGREAFARNLLTVVYIPQNVEEIDGSPFSGCSELNSLVVSEENQYYASFENILYTKDYATIIAVPAKIEGVVRLAEGVQHIENNAFSGCSKMTEIILPDSLKSIGQYAFSGCRALQQISIPASVEEIGNYCFEGCLALETADLRNLKTLGAYTFYNCRNLTEVILNSQLTVIPHGCFGFCAALIDIELPDTLISIGPEAFSSSGVRKLHIPKNVAEIGWRVCGGCVQLTEITTDTENPYFKSLDGILYTHDLTEVIAVPGAISGIVNVPEGVKIIGDGIFANCFNITEVNLPSSLEIIDSRCFQNCFNLQNIVIGSNVKRIGLSAFENTAFSNDEDNWENGVLYLGDYAIKTRETEIIRIREGTSLIAEWFAYGNSELVAAYIPDSVKILNSGAFISCTSLKQVNIGNGVRFLDGHTFHGCTSLKSVRIPASIEDMGDYLISQCEKLEYVVVESNEHSVCKGLLREWKGGKVLAIPYCSEETLFDLAGFEWNSVPTEVIITTAGKKPNEYQTGFLDGIPSDRILYSYLTEDDYYEGWNHGCTTYYKDEWHLATFYADDIIVTMDPILVGEVVQAPAESLVAEFLWPGSEFLGWDINGDGKVDEIPVTLAEDLEARAVLKTPITGIALSETDLTMEVTDEKALAVSYTPSCYNTSDALIWSSSNEAVATVDESGKITALAEGQATITATLAENGAVSAFCTVTVIPLQPGIQLAETTGTLNVGEILTLEPRYVELEEVMDTLAFTSSDEAVATVDQTGTITAIAPGTAEVTISCGEYTAVYTLTVLLPAESMAIEAPADAMNVGEDLALTVVFTPENTTDNRNVTWTSSDGSVARISASGVVTAVAPGTVTITAQTASGLTAKCEIRVYAPIQWITLNTTVGTLRLDRTKQLEVIYEPSNTTDDRTVVWTSGNPEIASVSETGLVTGLKRGTTVITGQVGEHTATYTVTVIGLRDAATGITVTNADDTAMEENMSILVDPVDNAELEESIIDQIEAGMASDTDVVINAYDISLLNSGESAQPDRTVDVDIPLEGDLKTEDLQVFRVEEDGTLTDMTAQFREEKASFQTEHFSLYVVCVPKKPCENHTVGEWQTTKEPTCTETGEKQRSCSSCGKVEKETLPAKGHSYESVVTAPTCEDRGYTTHTCSRCGDIYVDSYTDPVDHVYEDGYCKWCDEPEGGDSECTDHTYEDVVTGPTCEAHGYTTYTCTKCGESYVSDYTDPVDHVYEDGHCKWCGLGEQYVKWYSGTTSLNGTIDLNIYVLLSQDLVEADDTYVRFIRNGNIVDVPMADAQHSPTAQNSNRYRFSCPIYAKQLADNVTVKFMKGDQQIGKGLNYSVVQYCVNQIKKVTNPQELALYKAMLNYGAAAQKMFSHNLESLANASLSDADKVLPSVDASAYKYSVSGKENGIKAKSATLMLEDVVKVRVYFELTGDKSIGDYTFTIDGKVVTPEYSSKGWYVETDGIAAKDLEKLFEIQVGGITVKYGALSYVNSKIVSSTAAETEKNIAKALYAYWQAAENYLG